MDALVHAGETHQVGQPNHVKRGGTVIPNQVKRLCQLAGLFFCKSGSTALIFSSP